MEKGICWRGIEKSVWTGGMLEGAWKRGYGGGGMKEELRRTEYAGRGYGEGVWKRQQLYTYPLSGYTMIDLGLISLVENKTFLSLPSSLETSIRSNIESVQ